MPRFLTPHAAHSLRQDVARPWEPIAVHPGRWQKPGYAHLGRWQALLSTLPATLTNSDVFIVRSSGNLIQLFLWSMAWGFGGDRQAYGPWRTDQMLAPIGAPTRLVRLMGLAAIGAPGRAFAALHDPAACRLPWLGTAFGSKVLYFAGFGLSPTTLQPLVLDAMVTRAFQRANVFTAAGKALFDGVSSVTKDPRIYEAYVSGVYQLRERHAPAAEADAVERWLWRVGARYLTI
jgi:hypothetical protein